MFQLRRLFGRSTSHDRSLRDLEGIIGYQFHDVDLLERALTHRSLLNETGEEYNRANEVLEFLGDAVLELIVVEYLVRKFPYYHEGELSKLKSILVSGKGLALVARRMKLGGYILISQNEERNGGRFRGSLLEDCVEALVAAIYLDSDITEAGRFVKRWILSRVDGIVSRNEDPNYKSQLLEYVQARGYDAPIYNVIAENGPDHAKQFDIEVVVDDEVLGTGQGRNKKAAEQIASCNALALLNNRE